MSPTAEYNADHFIVAGPWTNDSSDCFTLTCYPCGRTIIDATDDMPLSEVVAAAAGHACPAPPEGGAQ